MSMYGQHRGVGPPPPGSGTARLNELLDNIRAEFENAARASGEYEHSMAAQIQEMQMVREKVYAMEQTHVNLKAKYEEEIHRQADEIQRLARELEARGGNPRSYQPALVGGGAPHGGNPAQQAQPAPPAIGNGPSNLFGGIMQGNGGGNSALAPPPPQQQQDGQGPGGPPGPPHAMNQPPGLQQGPPGPPPAPFGQQGVYGQQQGPPTANGYGGGGPGQQQPPPSTASPGPGKPRINAPQRGPGPATPHLNQPMPYSADPRASPQVARPMHQPQPQPQQQQQITGPPRAADGLPQSQAPPQAQAVAQAQAQPPSQAGYAAWEQFVNALAEIDIETLPPQFKKVGDDDWFAIFNPAIPRTIDVELLHTLNHESVVCCVRFSHDGKYVATGCNRSAQIYELSSGNKVCVLMDEGVDMGGDLYIRSVCFSPDGRYLATGAEDKLIRVWDIASRSIRQTFSGHEQDIYSLDYARDGRTIASGSGDRTVRLWDIESGQNILTLTIEDGVTTVAMSPDTKYVAAGSLDKSVRVWDAATGYLLERLEGGEGHKDSVYSVAFAPNGKDLVSGSLDKTVKMWELVGSSGRAIANAVPKGGRCIRTYEGHKDFVLSVALTPDGAWVLSGSKDRGVQFWDPRSGTAHVMLQGHKNSVISVAPSPIGGAFATGSGDMRARIWRYKNL